ncbi:Monomethylxanthine methyltransferase, partial [Thalictrum thalictroides]
MSKAKPFVEKAIIELYCKTVPRCFTMADLGCSSGPNSLFLISDIINTIDAVRKKLGHQLPEFQVFLNDLPRNDFNTLFILITKFYEQLRKDKGDDFRHCYIAGMPGSFHGRLFANNTLLFAHSSYSVHWLSQ